MEKNLLPFENNKHLISSRVALRLVTIMTELSKFPKEPSVVR
jgi:hypothetical protein